MSSPSPGANLTELLSQWTLAFGWRDRPAFLCGDDVYTHGEVHRGARRAAALLSERGAVPGGRVMIALPECIEFVWALLGTIRLGAVALLADPETASPPSGELAVCAPGRHPNAITAMDLAFGMPRAGQAPAYPVAPTTPAFIRENTVFTHGDPETSYLKMQSLRALRLRQDDILVPVPRPYDQDARCDAIFLPLFCGAGAVLEPGPRSASTVSERLRRHRGTVLLATASFLTRLAHEVTEEAFEPLRVVVAHGAAPLPKHVARYLGCPVVTPVDGQTLTPA